MMLGYMLRLCPICLFAIMFAVPWSLGGFIGTYFADAYLGLLWGIVLSFLVYFLWIYSIPRYLMGYKERSLSLIVLKLSFLISNLYFMSVLIELMLPLGYEAHIDTSGYFVVLAVLAFLSVIYMGMSSARVVTRINRDDLNILDFLVYFLLLMMPIIGVWFVQPKIKRT